MTTLPKKAQMAYRRAALEEKAVRSLWGFVQVFWHILEPGTMLEGNWHHELICRKLEQVMRGEITDLVICIPPGHMKSLLASVFFPLYWWLFQPEKRIMCLSAVGAVTNRDAAKMLTVLQSPLYWRVLERVHRNAARAEGREWTKDHAAKLWAVTREGVGRIANSRSGERLSFTMHSSFTGPRADGFIVDDPYDVEEVLFGAPARIAERMEEIRTIFKQKLSSRLNDKRPAARAKRAGKVSKIDRHPTKGWTVEVKSYFGRSETHVVPRQRKLMVSVGDTVDKGELLATGGYFKILIMQRLHPDDLAGWLIDFGSDVDYVVLPTEYDPDAVSPEGKSLVCPEDPRTEPGELLHPSLFSEDVVRKAKSDEELGLDQFEAQHNQRPPQIAGGMFGDELFPDSIYYDEDPHELLTAFDEIAISVDCANKSTNRANYSAIGVWGRDGAVYYLLDLYHGKWEYDELEEAFRRACRTWPLVGPKLIEDKANGITLIQRMRKVMGGIVAVEPNKAVDPNHRLAKGKTRGKEDRAAYTKLALRAKQIRLPRPVTLPLVDRLVTEHVRFGSGYKDDMVDMTSQMIERWIVAGNSSAQSKRKRWQRLAI